MQNLMNKEVHGAAAMRPDLWSDCKISFSSNLIVPIADKDQVLIAKKHNAGVALSNLVPDIKNSIEKMCQPTVDVSHITIPRELCEKRHYIQDLLKVLGYKACIYPHKRHEFVIEISL